MKTAKKHTKKTATNTLKNHKNYKKDGWIHLEVAGTPHEIGFAHGKSLRAELKQVLKVLPYIVEDELKISYEQYLRDCKRIFTPILNNAEWRFIKEELQGIVAGALLKDVTYDFLVAWNSFLSMCSYYEKNHNVDSSERTGRCSAFIATGSATKTGEIVMAHNTHSDFATGFILNIVMRVKPSAPGSIMFVMQTAPGLICSSSDWFLCENGIIGCETTISNLNYVPDFYGDSKGPKDPTLTKDAKSHYGVPYYLRIRKAMQYGKTLDDYVEIMSLHSAGDYACTWFLGNINTGEIMMLEDGGKHIGVERTFNGAFHASNDAMTPEVALLDTTHSNKYNPDTSSGSRYLRMEYLLFDKYKGEIDTTNAKKILADHYDASKSKYEMGKMNICKHAELEIKKNNTKEGVKKIAPSFPQSGTINIVPFEGGVQGEPWVPLKGKGPRKTVGFPKGASDGKVVSSSMARKMQFEGRMGSSCGRIFRRSDYAVSPDVPILNMPKHKWTKLL